MLLLIGWMTLIFYMSQQSGSDSADSSNLVADIIYYVYRMIARPHVSMDKLEFLSRFIPIIRKTAHFVEFMILGILVSVNFTEHHIPKAMIIAVLFCILYAISDEIHQLFIINRHCSIMDMFIDSMGSLSGIIFYHLFA